MKLFNKWLQLPFRDKALLVKILFLLSFSKLSILLLHFKNVVNKLGELRKDTSQKVLLPKDLAFARKLKSYIYAVANLLPWKSKCFDKAITAKLILDKRNIPTTVYFGVAKTETSNNNGENKDLEAHAWVRAGKFLVTGGRERAKFTIVAFFS